jgi:enoyl-CoA hydratase
MPYDNIRYDIADRVAQITLARPDYRNAQSRRLIEELDDAFHAAADDTEVGAIILRGEGDHFSAGHDLGSPQQKADLEARPYEEGLRGFYKRTWDLNVDVCLRWRELPKPTIAAVQGYCIFGGWIIASSMDIVFAADDARFLPTNFQYFSVPWDLGVRKTKEILFESRFLGADEAHELGFVNRVVPRAELDDEALAYAKRVAQNDPFQLRMIKLAVNQMQDGQGFTPHIRGAHALYTLSSRGESDPAYALEKPDGKRRPMVQRALENSDFS